MVGDGKMTGGEALARVFERICSAAPEDLPVRIDRARLEIDVLLRHDYIDLRTAESAKTRLEGLRAGERVGPPQSPSAFLAEYPVPVVLKLCLQNSDMLSNWERDFILGLHQFPKLSARQFHKLFEIARKLGVKLGGQP